MMSSVEHGTSGLPVAERRSRADLRGGALGLLVLGYFALAWTFWGLSSGVPVGVSVPLEVVAVVGFAGLVWAAGLMFRRAARIPVVPGSGARERGRAIGRRFGIVVAVEFVGLAVVALVLSAVGHPHLIPAMICLGVGVHFFPLIRLFRVPVYAVTGVAMCAVAALSAVVALLSGQVALLTMLPGLGAALTLALTCAYLVRLDDISSRRA